MIEEYKIDERGQKYKEVKIEGFFGTKEYRMYENADHTGASGCGVLQDENDPRRKGKIYLERI